LKTIPSTREKLRRTPAVAPASASRTNIILISRKEFFTCPAAEARAQAEKIELEQYWKPLGLNGVDDQAVASKIFDMGVNMGVHQASVLTQRALNFLLSTGGAKLALPETHCTLGLSRPRLRRAWRKTASSALTP